MEFCVDKYSNSFSRIGKVYSTILLCSSRFGVSGLTYLIDEQIKIPVRISYSYFLATFSKQYREPKILFGSCEFRQPKNEKETEEKLIPFSYRQVGQ